MDNMTHAGSLTNCLDKRWRFVVLFSFCIIRLSNCTYVALAFSLIAHGCPFHHLAFYPCLSLLRFTFFASGLRKGRLETTRAPRRLHRPFVSDAGALPRGGLRQVEPRRRPLRITWRRSSLRGAGVREARGRSWRPLRCAWRRPSLQGARMWQACAPCRRARSRRPLSSAWWR